MRKLLILIIAAFPAFMSCEKLVDIPLPPNQLVSDQIYKDSATAYATIMGLYSYMIHGNNTNRSAYSWRMTTLPSMTADELTYLPTDPSLQEFVNNSILVENSHVNLLWEDCYRVINVANAIVQGASTSTTLSASFRNQLVGEAKVLRAFSYFELVNFFGEVPLVVVSDFVTAARLPRSTKDKVYEQIIADLLDAQANLSSAFHPTDQRTRINKEAATALLARVYLYRNDWARAEEQATTVINKTAVYNLSDNLDKAFLATSKQVIWHLNTIGSGSNATFEAAEFVPASASSSPTYVFRESFLADIEAGDTRMTNWMQSKVFNGKTYFYPYKYKVRTVTTGNLGAANQEFYVVLRLAEQYLIRAEARAQQNKLTGVGSAAEDVNIIRNKANLSNTTAIDKTGLLNAIEKERKMELFAEWGHRWFDLVRTGKANIVLPSVKGTGFWQPTDILYPVPNNARNQNVELTQNDGYAK